MYVIAMFIETHDRSPRSAKEISKWLVSPEGEAIRHQLLGKRIN
jgi:hypothetical protein